MVGHVEINFKKLDPRAIIPIYKYDGDSGMDIHALNNYVIEYGKCTMVETGLSAETITRGDLSLFTFEIQVRPRSGLAMNYGITIINTPATLDSTYTGSWKFPVTKLTFGSYEIIEGERFAQAVICPILSKSDITVNVVDQLKPTVRGNAGFGSTGRI